MPINAFPYIYIDHNYLFRNLLMKLSLYQRQNTFLFERFVKKQTG